MKNSPLLQSNGIIKCCRYAFMPNKLAYCGGRQNDFIFESAVTEKTHRTLPKALAEFETMFPYLKTIANANLVTDPFDKKVVEAYWLGNELLENVEQRKFYNHLVENIKLKKKLFLKNYSQIDDVVKVGFYPHHNFHVFNIWLIGKNQPSSAVAKVFDNCRISSGKILQKKENSLLVETDEVYFENFQLKIKQITKEVVYKITGESFLTDFVLGDFVSIHWNFVCEKVSSVEVESLKKATKRALSFYARRSFLPIV